MTNPSQATSQTGVSDEQIILKPLPAVRPMLSSIHRVRVRSFIALSLLIGMILLELLSRPNQMIAVGAVTTLLLLAALVWKLHVQKPQSPSIPFPSQTAIENARLLCSGHVADLSTLLDISREGFEPVIVTRLYSHSKRAASILVFAAPLLFLVMHKILGLPMWVFVMVVAGFGLLPMAIQSIRPLYYRITPGKLETLRSHFWSERTELVDFVNLAQAEIQCSCAEGRMTINPGEADAVTIYLFGLHEPARFVRAVFQAALCDPATTPNLPTDRLLG